VRASGPLWPARSDDTSDLAVGLSVADSLQRLARLVVPELADWVIIDLADENARPIQVAMLHRDGCHEIIERFSSLQPKALTEQAPITRVLATGLPILRPETSIDVADSFVSEPELLDLCDRLGICSAMYVPMVARGRTLGCLTLVMGVSGRHYDGQDLTFAMGLAQRAALVVDNSSLYEREHHIATVLQESLLPTVPVIPGLDIAARYRPSDTHAQVGGDFYDVVSLPDGTVTVMVGDVVGHDLAAAAIMGQLRGHLRACAWEAAVDGAHDPGAVLDRTDRLVQGLALTEMATVFYGRIDTRPGSDHMATLTYATAGHPMPLVRWPDGRTTELEGGGMVIGASTKARRPSGHIAIPSGSVLVAFTDGLVERRSRAWDDGLASVRRALEATPQDLPTGDLADLLLNVVEEDRSDDTVVLVVRFT
jgi:serine phosphatase RsbU (regulator of sigma subunit)